MLMKHNTDPQHALSAFHVSKRYGFTYFMRHTLGIEELVDNKAKICAQHDCHNQELADYSNAKGRHIYK